LTQAVAHRPLHLAPTSQLNERLSQITTLAAAEGLEVEGIQPGDAHTAPHYIRQPIRVDGNGGFEAAVQFLHRLHKNLPDVSVRSLKLTGEPGGAGQKPTFSFDLRWYAAPHSGS